MEQTEKTPSWKNWLIVGLIVTTLILAYIVNRQSTNARLDKANVEKKKITSEIDSLSSKRDVVIKTGKEKSQSAADNSKETIKTIENEKIYFVRDTTYNAMCDFIASYKPTVAE